MKHFWGYWHVKEIQGELILIIEELRTLLVQNYFWLWGLFQYIVSCLTNSFSSSCGYQLLHHIIWAFQAISCDLLFQRLFERLLNTPSVHRLFSKAPNIRSSSWITMSSVEWPNWKPNCLGLMILFPSGKIPFSTDKSNNVKYCVRLCLYPLLRFPLHQLVT